MYTEDLHCMSTLPLVRYTQCYGVNPSMAPECQEGLDGMRVACGLRMSTGALLLTTSSLPRLLFCIRGMCKLDVLGCPLHCLHKYAALATHAKVLGVVCAGGVTACSLQIHFRAQNKEGTAH